MHRTTPSFSPRRRASQAQCQDLAARLHKHVDILAGLIGPRHMAMPSTMEAAVTYIEGQFRAMRDTVTRQTYHINGAPTHNLIVNRPGTRRPDEVLLIGAHYDTEEITPGADDNASAVAMLLETARLMAPFTPGRTVRFVAFTNEEAPHMEMGTMGSQHHARNARARGEKIVGMLCLEMVGFYATAPRSQQLPPGIPRFLRPAFPSRGNFLASVANFRSLSLLWHFRRGFKRASRLPLYSVALPEKIPEIRRSDNSSFWDQGYPALMITDTSFLRNPHYHAPTDTPDTLDYPRFAQATLGVAGAIARLAQYRDSRHPPTRVSDSPAT